MKIYCGIANLDFGTRNILRLKEIECNLQDNTYVFEEPFSEPIYFDYHSFDKKIRTSIRKSELNTYIKEMYDSVAFAYYSEDREVVESVLRQAKTEKLNKLKKEIERIENAQIQYQDT